MIKSFVNSEDEENQIEDLKANLNVLNLKLKDAEFKLAKRSEDYEFQISKLNDDNNILKQKYEKINEAQRNLEKKNSDLEERLLKIVNKYESEQKSLLEELTIAHSKLVEMKLKMNDLEREKESFRQDCNIAVNLLQCKPNDFVNHSYNWLPINLKTRLKSLLGYDDASNLELNNENDDEYQKQKLNSFFKIPMLQPTAAAAMMYNIQNNSLQREKLRKVNTDDQINEINEINISKSQSLIESVPSNLNENNEFISETQNLNDNIRLSNRSLNKSTESLDTNGKVCSSLIAQVLKKVDESPSKKGNKYFPYICLRCKKELVLCDTFTQSSPNDLIDQTDFKIIYARENFNPHHILRSRTVGNELASMSNKSLENEKDRTTSTQLITSLNLIENKSNQEAKARLDSWSDLKMNTFTI